MRQSLFFVAGILGMVLAGLIIRMTLIMMRPVTPMVLRDDTRPLVHREASSSSVMRQENVIEVFVPAGMQFVASRKGKKYYAVDSAGGEKLTPENRVYFRTAAEAEAAGYQR